MYKVNFVTEGMAGYEEAARYDSLWYCKEVAWLMAQEAEQDSSGEIQVVDEDGIPYYILIYYGTDDGYGGVSVLLDNNEPHYNLFA